LDIDAVLSEYADLTPLQVRISTHEKYSERHTDPVQEVIDLLQLPNAKAVLDVGCGTGLFLRTLASAGHRGALLGLDTSPAATLEASTISGVRAIRGSATALPFATNSVDFCTARHMLYHVDDPAAALREFGRVTAPGGQVAVVVNIRQRSARMMDWVRAIADRFGADVTDNGLNGVNADSLPGLMEDAYGSVSTVRVDNALVFTDPVPLIAFATSNLSFCGVGTNFPRRNEIVATIAQEVTAWFEPGGRIWRDPKGYAICASRIV
jgi:SAM-dependent methyltransferase